MCNPIRNFRGCALSRGFFARSGSKALSRVWVCSLLLVAGGVGWAATTEDELLSRLASASSLHEKDAACAGLKLVATPKSVPALVPLLVDEQLSHSARYVLETLPGQEAAKALLEAVDRSDGMVKVGLIHSLGLRRDSSAVPRLGELARGADPVIAKAAIAALGEIGGTRSAEIILQLLRQSQPEFLRATIVDAALRTANDLAREGSDARERARGDARPYLVEMFQRVYDMEGAGAHARAGAFRGLVICAPDDEALDRIRGGLLGREGPTLTAALQLVPACKASAATETFARLLPELQASSRTALIAALQQRGDPVAAEAITLCLQDSESNVRAAAINALGILGDGCAALALAELAAKSTGTQQESARQALTTVANDDPDRALLRGLVEAAPAVQSEIARALAARGCAEAVARLISLARATADPPRTAALQALAVLVNASQLPELVGLVVQAPDEPGRVLASEALNTAYQRLLQRDGSAPLEPLTRALSTASPEAQSALLGICAGLPGREIQSLLRSAAVSPDERIRDAGIRAMCESRDPELFGGLASIARDAGERNYRMLALAACARFLSMDETRLPRQKKIESIRMILSRDLSEQEKKLLLAGLGEMGGKEALGIAKRLGEDPAVEAEADRAVLKISATLPPGNSSEAIAALKSLTVSTKHDALRKEASSVLEQIYSRVDYLTEWQVSGPYREPGKNFTALFDISFSPEKSAASDTIWRPISAGTDATRPTVVDLLNRFGGEQCVAYVRAWVHAEQAGPCVLELGSDDGAKVWLNGVLIHANNTARPVQCGSDKIKAELKAGWNMLVMKITQNNLGWEFCTRFVKPDGSRLEGLRFRSAVPESD